METRNNEPFWRQTGKSGYFKKTWKLFGLYFTLSNCRVKKRVSCGYSRKGHDGEKLWRIKNRLYKQSGGVCPECGRPFAFDVMELHHVLPYSRFQDLITDDRNVMMLCHDCHKEIHCNPYRNIKLMEAKAEELGINLDERYNR